MQRPWPLQLEGKEGGLTLMLHRISVVKPGQVLGQEFLVRSGEVSVWTSPFPGD